MLLFAPMLMAQSETGRAALDGRVFDPSGQTVSAAQISIRENQTGFQRKVLSNMDGQFRAGALPVGDYTVEVTSPGFGSARMEHLSLTVGETRTVNISLQIASSSSQVTVESSADIVNQVDPSNSVSINQRAVEQLPIRGRNFTDFIQLTPNVMQEANRTGIVVNGQRSINSNISIDGVDFNDSLQGGQRGGGPKESVYFFPQVAVREFQVVRNGASAEVGRTNSGYVNVVTKSGTNSYHGESFYANRNGHLTSPDAFGNDSSSNAQHQFGGAVGGPIQKDKLFFFAALEKNIVTIPYTVKFDTPSGGATIPADILALQGSFDQRNNPLVAFGRMDYQLNQANALNVQYTYAAQNGLNFGGASGQTNSASTNNTLLDRGSQGVKSAVTTVLTASLLNEVRGQYSYDNRTQQPVSGQAQVDIKDLGTIGGSKSGTYIYNATRYEILDNLTWAHGRHNLKAGFDMNINPQQQQRESNYGGAYTFATLLDYQAALAGNKSKIQQYQQTLAANGRQGFFDSTQKDYALFVTDTYKIRPDLTVTAGLRWDGQINPQPTNPNPKYPITAKIPSDLKMWQPRLGFAYNVGGNGTTVIRLSAGLLDARTPAYLMQRVFTDNGIDTLAVDSNVDPNVKNFLTIPNPLTSVPANLAISSSNSIYAFDPTFRNPRSGQVAVTLEQQLDRNTKVTIGFARNSTWNLQRRLDQNLFMPVMLGNGLPAYPTFDAANNLVQASGFNAATGLPIYVDSTGKPLPPKVARPDTGIGAINVNKSVAHSSYNGTSISIQRRMSSHLQFGINYTYAFDRDDDTNERDFNRQPALNTYNLKLDAAYAKNDIRHNGNLNVLYDIGHGFTISTLFIARTGMPVKPVSGSDSQNDGNTVNDRPVINGTVAARDAFRQPGFLDWDLRLLKEFKVGERMRIIVSMEGFNLMRASNKSFNGDGETTFGKPTATLNPNTGFFFANNTAVVPTLSPGTDRFGGPRQGQIGARFVF